MVNQTMITAFELSKKITNSLGLKIDIREEDRDDAYFEFSSDDAAVYIANVPLRNIAHAENRELKTSIAFSAVLEEAKHAIKSYHFDIDLEDCFLYCTFAILHELGHYYTFVHEPDKFSALIDEREKRCKRLKTLLQLNANLGHDEADSRVDYEHGYRNIPFEKKADDYAKRLMPRVLAKLLTEAGSDEAE